MFLLPLLIVLAADPVPSGKDILDSAETVTFRFWRFTDDKVTTSWNVHFDRDEIQELAPLLASAKPMAAPDGLRLYTSGWHGWLQTKEKEEYRVYIGTLKHADRPLEIRLTPVKDGKPQHDRSLFFQLQQEAGKKFEQSLVERMKKKAQAKKPIKVEKQP